MSDQTTVEPTNSSTQSTLSVSDNVISSLNKGKGKAVEPAHYDGDGDDDENDDDDDDEDEDEDDDENDNGDDLAEDLDDLEDFSEIDPGNIVYTSRRRIAPIDYTSEEAFSKAGINNGPNTCTDVEEEDPDFKADDMEQD